jgi:hypothetical protein
VSCAGGWSGRQAACVGNGGATYAPHHPTKEWVDKIHAMHLFDDGYDKLRERIFENQRFFADLAIMQAPMIADRAMSG